MTTLCRMRLRAYTRSSRARINMLASVDPIRSPTPMSGTSSRAAFTSVVISGSDVLPASRTTPIQARPSPVASAIASAARARRDATAKIRTPSSRNAVIGSPSPEQAIECGNIDDRELQCDGDSHRPEQRLVGQESLAKQGFALRAHREHMAELHETQHCEGDRLPAGLVRARLDEPGLRAERGRRP